MNWKCPQCGADDNEKSSGRCTCGYEPDEKALKSLQWVTPLQRQKPSPSAPNLPKTKKQKIGEALYIAPIVVVIAAIVVMITTDWNPTKKVILAIGSAGFFISTVSSLLTDDIGIRGVGAVKRVDKPGQYWTQFVIQTVLTLVLLFFAISTNE